MRSSLVYCGEKLRHLVVKDHHTALDEGMGWGLG